MSDQHADLATPFDAEGSRGHPRGMSTGIKALVLTAMGDPVAAGGEFIDDKEAHIWAQRMGRYGATEIRVTTDELAGLEYGDKEIKGLRRYDAESYLRRDYRELARRELAQWNDAPPGALLGKDVVAGRLGYSTEYLRQQVSKGRVRRWDVGDAFHTGLWYERTVEMSLRDLIIRRNRSVSTPQSQAQALAELAALPAERGKLLDVSAVATRRGLTVASLQQTVSRRSSRFPRADVGGSFVKSLWYERTLAIYDIAKPLRLAHPPIEYDER